MPIQAIRTRRLYRQIADQLGDLIAHGEFEPGSMLPPERELARLLGVSRASVREALIAMEVAGLVEVRVGAGVTVVKSPADDREASVMDIATHQRVPEPDPDLPITIDWDAEIPPFALLQARRLLEPETAALAARYASDAERRLIRQAYEQNQADNRDGSKSHPGDRLLHIRIAEASRNPAYALFIKHMLGHQYGAMFRRLQALYTPMDMPHRSEEEHRAVVEAIERGAVREARKAMRKHLDCVIAIFSRQP